jgi:hypothetical protein
MSTANKLAALPLAAPRFGVVEGGRKTVVAAQTPAPQALASRNTVQKTKRGLFVVDSENMPATVDQGTHDTFEQTRRIVAQVEQEIRQQVTREGHLRLLRLQDCSPAQEAKPSAQRRNAWQQFTNLFGF